MEPPSASELAEPRNSAATEALDKDLELDQRARAILAANWMGQSTRASSRLYPHQWSWDAAWVALAYSHWDQERAETEIRFLFSGQWTNGLLPHIRFLEEGRYFPGPEIWQVDRSAHAPTHPKTSGIVQPPIHATAVWQMFQNAQDRTRARAFLIEMLPRLTAWHAYLYRERTRAGSALVEIWHPWESMDNSPLWDAALARIAPAPDEIPAYERVDVDFVTAAQRPSKADYDLYIYLVALFRDLGYDARRIRERCPFAMRDVLFNSLLVQSNRDLAEIADELGEDAAPFRTWADETGAAIDEELWSDEARMYLDFDVRAEELVQVVTGAGFSPLYAGVPGKGRAAEVVERMAATAVTFDGIGRLIPTVPHDEPQFDPALYWRGPVWPVINWILHAGLRRYGYVNEARELRESLLELVRREGFWEHFNAITGNGEGTEELSWTAALVLDLLGAASADSGSSS
jgi:mannosylglycerate hydrolase